MLKRTTRRILAWSVVFAMLFSLTAQPAAAADTSADTSAAAYSAQVDEDAAEETTEAESDEDAEEEAETDPADDSGEADESAEESADASAGEDTGETEDEPAEESAEEPADESDEKATLTVSAATISEEEEEAETTVTASAYSYNSNGFYTSGSTTYYEPAEKNSSGYYEISNAGQLFWYAALTRGDTSQEGITKQVLNGKAVLTNDIAIPSGYTWIPGSDITGTFDGAGYAISGIYINSSSDYQGLFSQIGKGGTVKDLTVGGSITGGSYVGGIAGQCSGTISGCVNLATLSGNLYVGGITGVLQYTDGGGVTNCCNFGYVNGAAYGCGIVGWNNGHVTNCYNAGTLSSDGYAAQAICFNNLGSNSNCYYLSTASGGGNAVSKTAAQFASGEVAYRLNGNTSGGTGWYQNIDNDKTADYYPLPNSSHGKVYYGYSCTSTTASYSNSVLDSTKGHTYDDDGFCVKCGAYEPAELNSDGYYEIDNAGNLFWFAALVNGDTSNAEFDAQNTGANAVLTCDIDLSVTTSTHTSKSWTPIGKASSTKYSGTFDGKGYAISGMYRSTTSSNTIGLFGYVTGTVQNVSVSGTVKGLSYLGGIVAYNMGEISNCYSSATVAGNNSIVSTSIGGIAGYNSGTITNCYSIGAVTDKGSSVGSVVGSNSGTITNCYYLDTLLEDNYATAKSADQFASGEVAYLLNSGTTDGTQAWYQNLDNGKTVDSYPVLSSSHGTVYQCTGDTCTSVIYSNDADNNGAGAHDYDEDGFCTSCGAYEPAELNSDGYYEITNAGNLFWFAALVNSTTTITVNGVEVTLEGITGAYANTSNAILTCDIDLENREWTPIGAYNSFFTHYAGVFDGQGHTVSGLYVNSSSNGQGLFGRVREGGTVQNLIVSGSVTGGNYVGGLAGASGGTITNCASHCTVSGSSYVGGFVGYVSANTSVDANSVSNCYSTGTVSGSSYVGAFTSESSGTVTNCYYLDTAGSDDYATAKSADEFASGEVAWLLQNGQSAQVWGQTLTGNADAYPVLTDEGSRLVVKVTIQDEDEAVLSTSYINSGSKLDADVYPDTGAYAFYSDEACTKRIEDVVSQTYSADATVYVKAIVTATVYVDGAAETVSVVEGETYDLTALVPDGYLYGGAFTDEDFAEVIDPDTCGSGVAFTPEDGETYYVKLVDDSYFQIKCLLAYQSYTPTNLWLVTNIDSDGYQSYGFDLLYADDETDSLVVTDEATKQLYQELEINGKTYTGAVDISDFTGFTDDDYDEADLDQNLVGYYDLSEMVEEMIDADAVMFVPFFVTQDGVKVTGAVQRTISLTNGATSVSGMYSCTDESVASTASVADNDSGSVILLLSTSLRVSATALVTNIEDETTTYTITKYDGDTVTTQEVEAGAASGTVEYAEKDGYLFAGWFTDEDYTTAADFSDVTGDMTVYAKYVSADYLQVKASTVSSKGVVKSIRMISATDSKNYAEVGFVYQYGNVESSVEVTKYSTSISGKTAKSLFGVVTGSKLIYADLSVSGMEANTAVSITPYWVTLDGTTVYGTERTITYTGSGIE